MLLLSAALADAVLPLHYGHGLSSYGSHGGHHSGYGAHGGHHLGSTGHHGDSGYGSHGSHAIATHGTHSAVGAHGDHYGKYRDVGAYSHDKGDGYEKAYYYDRVSSIALSTYIFRLI